MFRANLVCYFCVISCCGIIRLTINGVLDASVVLYVRFQTVRKRLLCLFSAKGCVWIGFTEYLHSSTGSVLLCPLLASYEESTTTSSSWSHH